MLKLIIPILLAVTGTGAGVGAAIFLAPPPAPHDGAALGPCEPLADRHGVTGDGHEPATPDSDNEFVKLNNQFVIPVVRSEKVSSLVIVSLTLEIAPGNKDAVFAREPKLRDLFLQAMFDHANLGGFDGTFTGSNQLDVLRQDLFQVGRTVLGPALKSVLIVEIARQDA